MTDFPSKDEFSSFPGRPETEEFWWLSEILLESDGRCDEGEEGEFLKIIEEIIPIDTITYVAKQRALRVILRDAPPLPEALLIALVDPETLAALSAMFIDGFNVGHRYGTKHPKT